MFLSGSFCRALCLALGIAWFGFNVGEAATDTEEQRQAQTGNESWSSWTRRGEPIFKGQFWCASDPSVIRDGDIYRMFYTGVNPATAPVRTVICQALSKDGLSWDYAPTGDDIKGLAMKGVTGTWEEALEGCFILKKDDEYLLYYSGYRDEGDPSRGFPAALTVVRSKDGLDFERIFEKPILSPTPGGYDNDAVYCPTILKEDGRHYMVYCGHCYTHCDKGGGVRLLGATSDDGIKWTKRDEPVLEGRSDISWTSGGVAEPSLVKGPDGAFYLFFTGLEGEARVLGVARGDSPFGPWTINPKPIIVPSRTNQFGEAQVLAPCVLIEDGTVRMWHLSANAEGRIATAYAESPWPLYKE